MPPSAATSQSPSNDREGLSPSPEAPSPRILTIADLLEDEDDDIEFEPSTEQSDMNDEEEEEDQEEEEDENEYVGTHGNISELILLAIDVDQMHRMI